MLCKSEKLFPFLDLGFHPHSDQFRTDPMRPEMTYPLGLQFCEDCQLVQLTYLVGREELFTEDYLYESSITETANNHWQGFADSVCETVKPNGLIVEIGSNDGTLLQKFQEKGLEVMGIDPCKEVADIAIKRGIPTIVNFFNGQVVSALNRKASLIIGSNVFAHLDDYQKFGRNIKKLLADDGVLVLESPYIMNFIKDLEYSTVYHQHMLYTGIIPMQKYFNAIGMEIFDIKFTGIHGGSFRCYITSKGIKEVQPIVKEAIDKEIVNKEILQKFGEDTKKHSDKLFEIVYNYYKQGKKICCVSSPAKGMTQMNYTKLNNLVSFLTEKSKLKIGRFTPGGHLPILADTALVTENPDIAILLAWNFSKEIIRNNHQFKGIWIVPNKDIETINAS